MGQSEGSPNREFQSITGLSQEKSQIKNLTSHLKEIEKEHKGQRKYLDQTRNKQDRVLKNNTKDQ